MGLVPAAQTSNGNWVIINFCLRTDLPRNCYLSGIRFRGRCGVKQFLGEASCKVERRAVAVFGVLARGTNGPFRGTWKHLAVQTRLPVAFNWGQAYVAGRAGVIV
jgi:hypothetical protein